MRLMTSTIEGKGGVGKSTLTGLAAHAIQEDGKRQVVLVDCDTTNSTLASMFERVELVNPNEVEAAGLLVALMRREEDAMVIDTGARAEATFIALLERVLPRAKAEKISVVVFRPLTLSSFAQNNAVQFVMRLAPKGVKVVLVRNLSQGRTEASFADWNRSAGHKAALAAGAIEMDLSDCGVRWGDEIPAFGLSFQEVAMGDFSRIDPELQGLAREVFSLGVQAHIGMWIEENSVRLLEALRKLGIKL